MNKVILTVGAVTDPAQHVSRDGKTSFVTGRVVYDPRRENQNPIYLDFTAFGAQADFISKWVKKGTQLNIVARLRDDSYTDKDGKNVSKVALSIEEVEFANNGRRQQNGNGQDNAQPNTQQNGQQNGQQSSQYGQTQFGQKQQYGQPQYGQQNGQQAQPGYVQPPMPDSGNGNNDPQQTPFSSLDFGEELPFA